MGVVRETESSQVVSVFLVIVSDGTVNSLLLQGELTIVCVRASLAVICGVHEERLRYIYMHGEARR